MRAPSVPAIGFALALTFAAGLGVANAQVPPVYVPEMGAPPAERPRAGTAQVYVPEMGGPRDSLRFPDRIEPPRASRGTVKPPPRATVPAPTNPAARIEVPDTIRRGETSQDRIVRCQHYGTLYGVPDGQRATYTHRCVNGY